MSWQKVKLGQFLNNREGRYKPNDQAIQGLKRIDKINFSGTIFLSKKPSNTDMILVKKGDLVISGINVEKGAMNIYQGDEDVVATIHYSSYEFDEEKIDIDFLTNFLKSLEFKKALKEQVPGGIKTEIKPKHILPLLVEIPTDVKEQKRIVKKLIENNLVIKNISYELTRQLDLIKQLRQAFLREAMQGKLVKSTNTAATGQQLLEKIKAEKAQLIAYKKLKKEKELQPINEDEIPFDIPEHWVWCRLGEILKEIKYGTSQSCDYDANKNSAVLRIPNVSNGMITIEDLKYANLSIKERNDLSLEENDILIVRSNGSRELVGKTALVKKEFVGFCYAGYLIRLRYNSELINSNYLWLVSKSPFFREMIETPLRTTVGINNINTEEISLLRIPLPPLQEQQQIVAKLEELMAFCDGLEQSIKESEGYNEMLLQQVLREALKPKAETKVIELNNEKLSLPLKTILGAHIVEVCNTTDFGRVKFQKLLFLIEYHCKIDFDSHYVQKAAGPHDDVLIKSIESEFKRQRFFDVKQENSDTHRVRYIMLPNSSQIKTMFSEHFSKDVPQIDTFLMKLRVFSWEECEVIATIYAVWNNRIIRNEIISDELLYDDFMAWSARKSNFNKDFYKKLLWMREQNIVPVGWGNYIDKPEKKMA